MSVENIDNQMADWGHTKDVPPRQKLVWSVLTEKWSRFAGEIPELSLDIGAAHKKGRSVSIDPFPRGEVDLRAVAENLPFTDETFASVVMESVIKHVTSPEKSLGEIYRVTKDSGLLFLTSPLNYEDRHRHSFSYSEIRKLIQDAGFSIDKSVGYGLSHNFLNRMLTRFLAKYYTRLRIPKRFCRVLFVVARKV
ncbi:MAG: class I SAM-dependent methyltransferase [Candidatus Thorarchaeota archaeon]